MKKKCDECIYYKTEYDGQIIGCYHPKNIINQRMGFNPGTEVNYENRQFPNKEIEDILKNGNCEWFKEKNR